MLCLSLIHKKLHCYFINFFLLKTCGKNKHIQQYLNEHTPVIQIYTFSDKELQANPFITGLDVSSIFFSTQM